MWTVCGDVCASDTEKVVLYFVAKHLCIIMGLWVGVETLKSRGKCWWS